MVAVIIRDQRRQIKKVLGVGAVAKRAERPLFIVTSEFSPLLLLIGEKFFVDLVFLFQKSLIIIPNLADPKPCLKGFLIDILSHAVVGLGSHLGPGMTFGKELFEIVILA